MGAKNRSKGSFDRDTAVVGHAGPTDALTSVLTFLDTGATIPVPDDDDLDGEIVAADPEFIRAVEESRRAYAENPGHGTSVEEIYNVFGMTPHAVDAFDSVDGSPDVLVRVPARLHQALVDRAGREHTTIDALVTSFIDREISSANPDAA